MRTLRTLVLVLLAVVNASAQVTQVPGASGGGAVSSVNGLTGAVKLNRPLPTAASLTLACLGDSICGFAQSGPTYTTMLSGMPSMVGRTASVQHFSYSGYTIAQVAANYTANVHPVSPAVTGVPGILNLNGGTNDIQQGITLATMESGMSGLISAATADGWVVGVSTVMSLTGIPFRQTEVLRRNPFNTWLRTQYQAGAFSYLYDWDALVSNPDDPSVLVGGAHPTLATRYLMARQMDSVLSGFISALTGARLMTLTNIPYWDISGETLNGTTPAGSGSWLYVGEWVALATGTSTGSLTLTLSGEGGSYSYGTLYAQINSNAATSPVVNAIQGTYYAFQNINNGGQPEIQAIKFVAHPGATAVQDWDIYVQLQGAYSTMRSSALTSYQNYTWIPVMSLNATSPGADSSTVKSATIVNFINDGGPVTLPGSNPLGAYQHKINNSDGTLAGTITGGGVGGTTVTANAAAVFKIQVNGVTYINVNGGNEFFGSGTYNTVYRCTTAGTLPIGTLTTVAANCGAVADSTIRVQ